MCIKFLHLLQVFGHFQLRVLKTLVLCPTGQSRKVEEKERCVKSEKQAALSERRSVKSFPGDQLTSATSFRSRDLSEMKALAKDTT